MCRDSCVENFRNFILNLFYVVFVYSTYATVRKRLDIL